MEQENLQKNQKSKFSVIGTIWSIIIVGLVLGGVVWNIVAWLLLKGLRYEVIEILNALFIICILIYSVNLGIKLVLKKSIIRREEITKLSAGVVLILIIFQIVSWAVCYFSELPNWDYIGFIKLILIDISLFFITFSWFKKYSS